VKIIEGQSPVDVWKQASQFLIDNGGKTYNLLLAFPCAGAANEDALKHNDPASILGSGFDRATNVANTIFPRKTWKNVSTRQALYARYARAHARGHKKQWGTYFGRMIAFGTTKINQIERVIDALNDWQHPHRAALLIHTSSAETDKLRHLGGPCLQYIQFNCPDSEIIDLVAIYRNHDYCNKVLGNLHGLSRLLEFVCAATSMTAGRIVVHSIHAYVSTSLKNQKALIGA
jgi:thymidylate synthase